MCKCVCVCVCRCSVILSVWSILVTRLAPAVRIDYTCPPPPLSPLRPSPTVNVASGQPPLERFAKLAASSTLLASYRPLPPMRAVQFPGRLSVNARLPRGQDGNDDANAGRGSGKGKWMKQKQQQQQQQKKRQLLPSFAFDSSLPSTLIVIELPEVRTKTEEREWERDVESRRVGGFPISTAALRDATNEGKAKEGEGGGLPCRKAALAM